MKTAFEFSRRWVGGMAVALVVAGCSSHPALRSTTGYDRIQETMDKAAAQKPAPAADVLNEALLPPLTLDLPQRGKVAEPRFDLSVNAAPAAQVFLAIVSGTRYSMLLPPDLSGQLTLNLKNVTVREALESIREIYGYEFSMQGTRIAIQPNTMQTRLYQVSYLATKRGGGSATRVTSSHSATGSGAAGSAAPTGTSPGGPANDSTSVFTGQSTDFWFDLSQAIAVTLNCEYEVLRPTTLTTTSPGAVAIAQAQGQRLDKMKCPDGRNYVVNQQSGVVMVRAMPAELREIGKLLKAMQANVERQVMIEAKIIDVELNEGYQSGINWQQLASNGTPRWSMNAQTGNVNAFPPAIDAATTLTGATGLLRSFSVGGALGLAFQTTNFAALINFLQSQGTVHVMSSPRIATLNNQKAVLKVGSDDYFITSVTPPSYTSTGTTGTATTVNPPTITAQPFFSGIALDVTPQIDDGGFITLHIRPSVTEVSEKEKTINFGSQGTYTLPYASSKVKETDSIVRVKDGTIVAIGGLMSQTASDGSSKVPGAGDVPVANLLFRQNNIARGKREMVILLRPTVIREEADWQEDVESTASRMREYDPRRVPGQDLLKPQ